MSDPELTHRMYLMIKASQCRCEYERNAAGVPVWYASADGSGLVRKLIKLCSRCELIADYEAEQGK